MSTSGEEVKRSSVEMGPMCNPMDQRLKNGICTIDSFVINDLRGKREKKELRLDFGYFFATTLPV